MNQMGIRNGWQFQIHGLVTPELSFDALRLATRLPALKSWRPCSFVAQHKTVRMHIGVTAATACVRNFHVLGGGRRGPDVSSLKEALTVQYEVVAAALQ